MEIECSVCGDLFDPHEPRNKKYGLFHQCGDCGQDEDENREVNRHMGVPGGEGINKSGNISVVRGASAAVKESVLDSNSRYHGLSGLDESLSGVQDGTKKALTDAAYKEKRAERTK